MQTDNIFNRYMIHSCLVNITIKKEAGDKHLSLTYAILRGIEYIRNPGTLYLILSDDKDMVSRL